MPQMLHRSWEGEKKAKGKKGGTLARKGERGTACLRSVGQIQYNRGAHMFCGITDLETGIQGRGSGSKRGDRDGKKKGGGDLGESLLRNTLNLDLNGDYSTAMADKLEEAHKVSQARGDR